MKQSASMEPLKNIYTKSFINQLAIHIQSSNISFDSVKFQKAIFYSGWKKLELKARMSHISDQLILFLPKDFDLLMKILLESINGLNKSGARADSFEYMFYPEIIQKVGLAEFHKSMNALERMTIFTSAEFAIRYFYLKYPKETFFQMLKWSKHKHANVRRLASEGSRPLLPWAIGVPTIKKNPEQHMPILENLWDDKREVVRRSVANHLNDISKINPDLTWKFCKDKFGKSSETDKSLKHALRTLLKKGNAEILSSFAYDTKWKPKRVKISFLKTKIVIGDKLDFSIHISHSELFTKKIRVEYIISFLLSNGSFGNKVFQLGDQTLEPGKNLTIQKKHSFALISTRTYYPGEHRLTLVINGNQFKKSNFVLEKK